ncbi:MAG: polysaccharide biosynthesis/export family protein [Paludibacteraceae bacterium]|nr:polysaccharide biosynthesis/export family protein [Paludibacteraceae bacterium]
METYRHVDTKQLIHSSIGLCLFICIALTSCITNKSTTLLQEGASFPVQDSVPYTYYRIQPDDELVMQVLSINEEVVSIFGGGGAISSSTTTSYKVYDDGTIDIPFISMIYVKGLTVREAAKAIEQRVREFAPDATVKLGLANDVFYLLTDKKTGKFPLYKEKLTIFQALSLAGGLPENADRQHVRIIRKVSDSQQPIIKEFDIRSKNIIHSEFYYIQPNDMIYVSSIKGDFFKVSNYSATISSITGTLSFLLLVLGIF